MRYIKDGRPFMSRNGNKHSSRRRQTLLSSFLRFVKGETKGLPPAIADAIFSLSEGEYSEIVEFGENFFIVLTNEKHKAYEPSLEELGPLIETKLITQRLEGPLGLWLKGLSDKAEIEIVYPIFKDMVEPGLMVPEGE